MRVNSVQENNLNYLILNSARQYASNIALSFGSDSVSYQHLYETICRLAQGLHQLGIRKGDRVAVMLPNIPQFPISYYAILKIGAICVPINIMSKAKEIHYLLGDSESKAIILWESFLPEVIKAVAGLDSCNHIITLGEKLVDDVINLTELIASSSALDEAVPVLPEDTAVILYTAGTTGYSKGAELTHRNLSFNALACAEIAKPGPSDVILGVLPFYHSFGQTVVMNAGLISGARIVLLSNFEPDAVFKVIKDEGVTIFASVPTMLRMLLDASADKVDFSSIKYCLCGGAKLETSLMQAFEEKFGILINEGYGLTETSPVVSFNPFGFGRKPGSVGVPLKGVNVKVVDENGKELPPNKEGEIIVSGPNVMKGYLNRPEATKEVLKQDWFYTGDIGKIDEDGYIYILDRKKDLIIKGGFNVYPREVEELLLYHPKVKEVAVIGVPDSIQGEEVKAYVVLKDGKRASKDEIINYCQEHMALYKCPKYVVFLRQLPKSPAGRVLKRRLKAFTAAEET
ncbi:hypothetical protein B5M50_05960 [candidate division KSB1 bacterium 4484_219]|nr:MAG: hypothetical protein B5M50_05960 [candidate division KSB1 bacterium 4484_219]